MSQRLRRLVRVRWALAGVVAAVAWAQPAAASVKIVPTAQCRGTSCLVQLVFSTDRVRTAVVGGGGVTTGLVVRSGATRRLARVAGTTSRFRVRVRFEGRTRSRVVARRAMPVNRESNQCARLAPTAAHLSVGPTSAATRTFTIPSRGAVRIAVIFVDFSDAPSTRTTSSVMGDWIEPGIDWITASSYARVRVETAPVGASWLRMPKPSTAYGMDDGVTYDEHLAYIADAIALADPVMNFTGVDGIYIVGSDGVAIPQSPTFGGSFGTFVADGQALGPAVTFGTDAYTWGRTIVPHETGHMFGLPDLYGYVGDQHRFVGVWDVMGNVFEATDLTAWQRRKLDWLLAAQILCGRRTGTSWTIIEPMGGRGGAKALFIRTGTTTGLVVENRRRIGNDRGICTAGALVTTVNSAVDSGLGPIRVVGGDRFGAGCGYGPRSDAPLGVGESVTVGRTTVRVLGSQGGRLEISLTRR